MTSEWKPKSTTATEKIVTVEGGALVRGDRERHGDRGRQDPRRHQEDPGGGPRAGRASRSRSTDDERKHDQRSRGRRSLDMTRDEVLPFGPDKRAGYDFTVEGTADLDGAPVVLLRSALPRPLRREARGALLRRPGDLRRPPGRADPGQDARSPQAHGDGDRLPGPPRGPPGDDEGRHAHPRRAHRQEHPRRGRRDLQRPRRRQKGTDAHSMRMGTGRLPISLFPRID
ncbi:MAG: hypothetical protein MZU79_07265 [Anaerotruncus sp.]|nr:hypothetical protein [Anaerotruncus sp.]